MTKTLKETDAALAEVGVKDPAHQAILLAHLPCGIETAQEALKDGTPVQINAARAIMVCTWKGMVAAFRYLEAAEATKS